MQYLGKKKKKKSHLQIYKCDFAVGSQDTDDHFEKKGQMPERQKHVLCGIYFHYVKWIVKKDIGIFCS